MDLLQLLQTETDEEESRMERSCTELKSSIIVEGSQSAQETISILQYWIVETH